MVALLFLALNCSAKPIKHPPKNKLPTPSYKLQSLNRIQVAELLGWFDSPENRCGGYYIEPAFLSAEYLKDIDKIEFSGDTVSFPLHGGVSTLEGKIKINYGPRQITADKAYLYRDPVTHKVTTIDLSQNLHLREPNTLVVAQTGHVNAKTKENYLNDIIYRTEIYSNILSNSLNHPGSYQPTETNVTLPLEELLKPRKVQHLKRLGIC